MTPAAFWRAVATGHERLSSGEDRLIATMRARGEHFDLIAQAILKRREHTERLQRGLALHHARRWREQMRAGW